MSHKDSFKKTAFLRWFIQGRQELLLENKAFIFTLDLLDVRFLVWEKEEILFHYTGPMR